jgi:hypothetical protein
MAGLLKITRHGVGRYCRANGMRTIIGGNASRHAFACLYGDGEIRSAAFLGIANHQGKV